MKATTEKAFEAYINETMSARGWISGSNQFWNKKQALFPEYIISFIKAYKEL
jgi:type I restriction enzyme, R subunit